MPLYVADYLADTGHLTTEEHGAYMLLIMHYWRRGGLPANDEQLARICKMTNKDFSQKRATLCELFSPGWIHSRIDRELAKSAEISQKRSKAAMQMHAAKDANADTLHSHNIHKQEPTKRDGAANASPPPAIPPLPDCLDRSGAPQAVEAWNTLADERGLAAVQRLTTPRRTKLRRRLHECGGGGMS